MRVREDLRPYRLRLAGLLLLLGVALLLLVLRLAQLQIAQGAHWRGLAESNRLRQVPVLPVRGRIYDRNGELLAGNEPAFQLLVYTAESRSLERALIFLAQIGVGSPRDLKEVIRQSPGAPDAPRVLAPDLTWSQVCAIRAHRSDFPELAVVQGFRRVYPAGPLTAHVLGYVRLPTRKELVEDPALVAGILVGASGVERSQNGRLMGSAGKRLVVVDARGRELGTVERVPAEPGADLTLTLDLRLQRVAAEAMGERAGAVVALDPATGAVRVLYSSPSFDPNAFARGLSREEWEKLRTDPEHPLQDRCLRGEYPPGSTIKPFMALTGLEAGVIDRTTTVWCSGSITIGDHTFRCWARWGHGRVGLVRSLEVSCDVFYYTLGQKLGIARIAPGLGEWGFGSRTGLDTEVERPGLVGTPEWSRRVRHRPWYPGATISVAIGQGPLLVTPIQLARAFAALAEGGRLPLPYLVARHRRSAPRDLEIPPAMMQPVLEGLRMVVAGPEGTARRLAPLPIAGKTGTVQVIRKREGVDSKTLERRFRHHAWFVGWAPVEHPRLVVAVIVEHGGEGSAAAAPVAGAVLKAALEE